MNILSRETARVALANLLRDALTGSTGVVSEVYPYGARGFGSKTPVIAITSAGSERTGRAEGQYFPMPVCKFSFIVHIFVLYAARGVNGELEWDEEDAECALDTVEAAVIKALLPHTIVEKRDTNVPWDRLAIGESTVDTIVLDNCAYRYEMIPVSVQCVGVTRQ